MIAAAAVTRYLPLCTGTVLRSQSVGGAQNGMFGALAEAPCRWPWRVQYRLPRVCYMRYLLEATEPVEPLLPVVVDGGDDRWRRLCCLPGGSP